MTRTRYRIFETEYPYFLTNTIVAWLPIFSHHQLAEIIFDSWRFLQREHNNPLRRGYVGDPTHWRYSSARKYARQPSLIEIETDWR